MRTMGDSLRHTRLQCGPYEAVPTTRKAVAGSVIVVLF